MSLEFLRNFSIKLIEANSKVEAKNIISQLQNESNIYDLTPEPNSLNKQTLKQLNNGQKYVPHISKPKTDIKNQFKKELANILSNIYSIFTNQYVRIENSNLYGMTAVQGYTL